MHAPAVGMLNHSALVLKKVPSRRQVQRRFPPGSFVLNEAGIIGFVVGWAPVAPDVNPRTGYVRSVATWEALLLLSGNVLTRWKWEGLMEQMNLDEWEEWITRP